MLVSRLASRELSTDRQIQVNSTEWFDFESMLDSELMPVNVHSLYGLLCGCIHQNDEFEYAYLSDILYTIGFYLNVNDLQLYNLYLSNNNAKTITYII